MQEHSVNHSKFAIERRYDAAPARVFSAWSVAEHKLKWFSCHEGAEHALDFRVGGREFYRGGPAGGPVYTNHTHYYDIIPEQRIVYCYEMYRDDARISVSLVTIEFQPAGSGTKLVFSEQAVFLDGHDSPAQREHGTALGLDQLAVALAQ